MQGSRLKRSSLAGNKCAANLLQVVRLWFENVIYVNNLILRINKLMVESENIVILRKIVAKATNFKERL